MGPILPVGAQTDPLVRMPSAASEPERLKAAAQELEGVFIGVLMKAMRSTVSQGGLFKEGSDSQTYHEMFDEEIGRALGKSGGIGLAEMILRDQTLRQSAGDQRGGIERSPESPQDDQPTRKRSSFPDGVPIQPTVR